MQSDMIEKIKLRTAKSMQRKAVHAAADESAGQHRVLTEAIISAVSPVVSIAAIFILVRTQVKNSDWAFAAGGMLTNAAAVRSRDLSCIMLNGGKK